MEAIRYKPGEAVRWLEVGADDLRKQARESGGRLVRRAGERTIGRDIRDAAGVILGMGKSALADLLHHQAQAAEYVLHEDRVEVVTTSSTRVIRYDQVTGMHRRGERVTLVLESGALHIKPVAHIVAGRIRVPVGWTRNGMEVPYEVLIDELSARCGRVVELVS